MDSRVSPASWSLAIVLSVALGSAFAAANVYASLRTGWSLPSALATVLLAHAASRALTPWTGAWSKEQRVVVVGVASSAAFMSGGGNVAAIPALLSLGREAPPPIVWVPWFALLAATGVLVGVVLWPRFSSLAFPTGTAAAALDESLHEQHGSQKGVRGLVLFAVAGGVLALARAAYAEVRAFSLVSSTRLTAMGLPFDKLTLGLEPSLMTACVGGLVGMRVGLTMAVSGVLFWALGVPVLVQTSRISSLDFPSVVSFSLWPAAGLLIGHATSALLWDTLANRLRRRDTTPSQPSSRAARMAWALLGAVAVLEVLLGVPPIVAGASLIIAWWTAVVATRSLGETDVVPTRALAPVVQLAVAALAPGATLALALVPNMACSIGLHAANTASNLRTAERVGVRPRVAAAALVGGVLVGAVTAAVSLHALVTRGSSIPSASLPAPLVVVWGAMVAALSDSSQSPVSLGTLGVGAAFGALFSVAERALGSARARYVPSCIAIGSALVLPASTSATIGLGAVFFAVLSRRRAESCEPLAAGGIAGEGVVGLLAQIGRG